MRRKRDDEFLNHLLALVPEGDDEGRYTDAFRVGLLNARLDVRRGRVTNHSKVKRQLNLR